MDYLRSNFKSQIMAAQKEHGLTLPVALALILFPFVAIFLCSAFLALPLTRSAAAWMLKENRPVEIFTFVILIIGGIKGLQLAWQIKIKGEQPLVLAFYLAFSMGLLLIGLEEISWGQQFFGFGTPDAIQNINAQNETNLHNLGVWQNYLEMFPLIFGIAGLVSIWIARLPALYKLSAPYILLLWFVIIALFSAIDLLHEFVIILPILDILFNQLDELVEMLVGVSGMLYIWLNAKRFWLQWQTRDA